VLKKKEWQVGMKKQVGITDARRGKIYRRGGPTKLDGPKNRDLPATMHQDVDEIKI